MKGDLIYLSAFVTENISTEKIFKEPETTCSRCKHKADCKV